MWKLKAKATRLKLVEKLGRAPLDSPNYRGVTLTKVANVTTSATIL